MRRARDNEWLAQGIHGRSAHGGLVTAMYALIRKGWAEFRNNKRNLYGVGSGLKLTRLGRNILRAEEARLNTIRQASFRSRHEA